MLWVRRFFGQIFSLIFLSGLLLTALAFSSYQTFREPDNLKRWLSESQLYDHFTDGIAEQSFRTVSGQGGAIDNREIFQQAAKQAFPPELIEQSVETFITSNYDWLRGNTPVPTFSIDLTEEKAIFARQVALKAQQRLFNLPACTAQQAAQINAATDPLTLSCLPQGTDPALLAQQIQQKLLNSPDFLRDPIITADNVNPNGGEPYYKVAASAPRYFQLSQYAASALAAFTLLIGVITFFLSPSRRVGIRRLGLLLGFAGLILLAEKIISGFMLEQIRSIAFNNTSVGELQISLTDFISRVEGAIFSSALWFGVTYIAIGIILLLSLLLHKKRTYQPHKTIFDEEPVTKDIRPLNATPPTNIAPPRPPIVTDIIAPPRVEPAGPPPLKPDVKPRKKPRLVQL